jgi:hypothetical protein
MWTHRRQAAGKTPLLALEVIDSPQERAAVYALFAVVALEASLNFSVPLYIQIVQGQSPLATAIAMMPFNLTVFLGLTEVCRKSSDAVEGTPAEQMASEVEDGSGAKV